MSSKVVVFFFTRRVESVNLNPTVVESRLFGFQVSQRVSFPR